MIDLKAIEKIAHDFALKLVYLFGSKAKEINTPVSDIDIAIFIDNYEHQDLRQIFLDLIFEFSQLFKSDKIDLLILNEAPITIQFKVISEGKPLFQVNPEYRADYEENVVKLYLDFKKFEDDYYETMHKRILGAASK
ncbi:MAG: nucleotidyltransferase domain-containing protein [Promethearchaeota archaeon]|nr:MAG: nucleotidyltransferase domain-containing protein [Candidatus Lokiarchaeota archaeon]